MTALLAAGIVAEGHGPGRNPWWVNVILVVLLIAGLIAWRVRAARKRRLMRQSGLGQAGER